MRRILLAPLLVLLLASAALAVPCDVTAYFTNPPGNGVIENVLLSEIRSATLSIHLAMYSLSDAELVTALVQADARGVPITVLLESGQTANADPAQTLASAGISVFTDTRGGYFHNKYAIFDLDTVVTGSYNWSGNAATDNFENIVLIRCASLAGEYYRAFQGLTTAYAWTRVVSAGGGTPPPAVCQGSPFVGNKDSKVFHEADCGSVKQMSDANKVCLASIADAVAQGYRPCGTCDPCGADGVCP
jgi:hypothetical protein